MIEDQTEAATSALEALLLAPAPGAAGRPPLSSACSKSCHIRSNLRKLRAKRTVRVPAISTTVSDIPADEHSWRMYGQKPINGTSYFRAYYKCSTVRGCPARKFVELALDEPSVLILNYEGEHHHANGAKNLRMMIPSSL